MNFKFESLLLNMVCYMYMYCTCNIHVCTFKFFRRFLQRIMLDIVLDTKFTFISGRAANQCAAHPPDL